MSRDDCTSTTSDCNGLNPSQQTHYCRRTIFFFFNDPATTEIYTLSLHDALPICYRFANVVNRMLVDSATRARMDRVRSEEHTSELQSQSNLVCRLLLEKKKPVFSRELSIHFFSKAFLFGRSDW